MLVRQRPGSMIAALERRLLDLRCMWRRQRYAVRTVRRVVPFLLVLLAAVPEAALAGQWYRCTYTGKTRDTCCCPAEAGDEAPRSELKRKPCCEVLRNEPSVVAGRTESRAELRSQPGPVAVAPADVVPVVREVRCAPVEQRATAPPRARDPIYLRHASLLL